MRRKKTESEPVACEMIDESDSSEDSDDEDYELGDKLFSPGSSKGSKRKSPAPKKANLKRSRTRRAAVAEPARKKPPRSDPKAEFPSPPNTSRLFQIVITRKHARLSSCLQRAYLSLASNDKYVTVAEVLSFICECAGFKPGLVHHSYLEEPSHGRNRSRNGASDEPESTNFDWNYFTNFYSELPASVSYHDVLNLRDSPELDEAEFYGRTISFDRGDSVSYNFYAMCNLRIKNLLKKLDVKDGWMIDFGSAGFPRFCEFFNELVLQAEMQYFKDLVLLLQWVFALSLSPYRSIRLLSCVACNELLSALLVKLDTLRKDQLVLKKQLSVEAELDKRTAARLGGLGVGLSGSTLELYKRLSLLNMTCSVISAFVKASFYVNHASKLFDVFQDIRVLSAYYLVVHSLISPKVYSHRIYVELVSNFLLSQDDNMTLLLKYLLVYRGTLVPKAAEKLLSMYPSANPDVNQLLELLFLKCLTDKEGHQDGDLLDKLKDRLFDPDFVYENVVEGRSVYYSALLLTNYFPDTALDLKFSLNLAHLKPRYAYMMNLNNKVYNAHVYTYTRKGRSAQNQDGLGDEKTHADNMRSLCKTLLTYEKRDDFGVFVDSLVENFFALGFFTHNLSYIRYSNYLRLTTDLGSQALCNRILLQVVRFSAPSQQGGVDKVQSKEHSERLENMEDFVSHCEDVYKLNKGNPPNLANVFGIYHHLVSFDLESKFKLADLVLNNFPFMLSHPKLTSVSVTTLASLLNSPDCSALDKDRCTSKINLLFNANVLKLVEYIDAKKSADPTSPYNRAVTEEAREIKVVLFTLNHLLMSFNFIKLCGRHILSVYGLPTEPEDDEGVSNFGDQERGMELAVVNLFKSNGLYSELLIFYYLLYELVVFNVLNDPGYAFEGLEHLQRRLLWLLTESTRVESLMDRGLAGETFVILSTVLSVFKLSNADFLKTTSYKFKLEPKLVSTLEECVTYLMMNLYKGAGGQVKEVRENAIKRRERPLSIINDGGVTVNFSYQSQSALFGDWSDLVEETDSEHQVVRRGSYLKGLTPLHIAESLTYQYTKTLNAELFNSNTSLVLLLNSCSGLERVKRAALKFLEVLSRFNAWLFSLLSLHAMFTLYEISQNTLLEQLVQVFNQFENQQIMLFLYEAAQYVSKSQSNEKFQRYLVTVVMGNVNTAQYIKDFDTVALSSALASLNRGTHLDGLGVQDTPLEVEIGKDRPGEVGKETKFKPLVTLMRCIQVNSKAGTERYNTRKVIAKVLNSTHMQDENFNSCLLLLRRALKVKAVESLCKHLLSSLARSTKAPKPAQAPRTAPQKGGPRRGVDDTTLVPNGYHEFNDATTHDPAEVGSVQNRGPVEASEETKNDLNDSPAVVRNYSRRVVAPSFGIRGRIAPIELRDDGLDPEDLEDFAEYEPVFEGLSDLDLDDGVVTFSAKSSCVPSRNALRSL